MYLIRYSRRDCSLCYTRRAARRAAWSWQSPVGQDGEKARRRREKKRSEDGKNGGIYKKEE